MKIFCDFCGQFHKPIDYRTQLPKSFVCPSCGKTLKRIKDVTYPCTLCNSTWYLNNHHSLFAYATSKYITHIPPSTLLLIKESPL